MKSESIVFPLAGVAFGLLAGGVIGTQQTPSRVPAAPAQASAPEPAAETPRTRAALLDEAQATALKSVAAREPTNARPRAQLGDLYFDAERYAEAIQWYGEAVKLAPGDVNISTDLGICYYYTNQPDKALQQFEHSLKLDPKHVKTLLNVGIVKAFGKQDLDGALQAWQQVMQIAPDSPEGQSEAGARRPSF